MAAADVAVACLHEKAADALLGAWLRRAAADATLSCGATRALSKTLSRRVSTASPRRRLAVVAPPPECRPHVAVRLRAAAPLLDPFEIYPYSLDIHDVPHPSAPRKTYSHVP